MAKLNTQITITHDYRIPFVCITTGARVVCIRAFWGLIYWFRRGDSVSCIVAGRCVYERIGSAKQWFSLDRIDDASR